MCCSVDVCNFIRETQRRGIFPRSRGVFVRSFGPLKKFSVMTRVFPVCITWTEVNSGDKRHAKIREEDVREVRSPGPPPARLLIRAVGVADAFRRQSIRG